MTSLLYQIPQSGLPNSTEDAKVTNALTLIQNVINGNLDSNNIAASLGQAAGVNVAGQTVKGATNIAASESRSNTAFGTMPTPDQVTGIVLPVNGLIAVWYQATWQESVNGTASADIFIGSNQIKGAAPGITSPGAFQATLGAGAAKAQPLATYPMGLASSDTGAGPFSAYSGDVTTGQVVGTGSGNASSVSIAAGGPCYIFASAGTYTVSIQFKSSSGSVTVQNRKLWVQALSFA